MRLASPASALSALLLVAGLSSCAPASVPPRRAQVERPAAPVLRHALGTDPAVRRHVLLGRSSAGRPVMAWESGDPDGTRRLLVVGCIHGSERAGIAVADVLRAMAAPPEVDVWVVPDMNPDGAAAGTRGNAQGVDLNRNFPYRWAPLERPGDLHYSGRRALSEPESREIAALLRRVRPSVAIWYHQALDVVDDSQGPLSAERRYARDTGMPLRSLEDYPGSAVGYEDSLYGPTAFVVELPAGSLGPRELARHVRAVLDVAAS